MSLEIVRIIFLHAVIFVPFHHCLCNDLFEDESRVKQDRGRGAGTHGKPGHPLNVYVGQAPSGSLHVSFDARGGHGATTEEIDQPAGKGSKGSDVTVYEVSTWSNIIRCLQATARILDEGGLLDDRSDSDQSDDDQRHK
ncbi:hypothetical protein BDW62DRAFT_201368 [Aspergillus aurantiobrunneus]